MKTHVEQLIEKWAIFEPTDWKYKHYSRWKEGYDAALYDCVEDLKDALLLDEADRVGKGER